jgi:hypothetical protein
MQKHAERDPKMVGGSPAILEKSQTMRRFPPPWTVEKIPGGFKVVDANGQSLAPHVYSRETKDIAHQTLEEERWT